jgi:S1-C subfamily serine protease
MAASQSATTVLYFRPTCPDCRRIYDLLTPRQVGFDAYDVSQDPHAQEAMIRLSGQHNVPVLAIGNEVIVGFDLRRLDELFPRHPQPAVQLGISIASAKPGQERPAGAYIGGIKEDSLADRSGLRAGDIIIEMEQKPVRSAPDIHTIVSTLRPGEKIALTVWRSGRILRLTITI